MKKAILAAAAVVLGLNAADGPQFTAGGKLILPQHYREWVFLSSGLGMTYGPLGAGATNDNPRFDNVFVTRAAYKSFLETGTWPDKTMFILEVRSGQSNVSINNGGRSQGDIVGIEANVKDEHRFPGKWGFFAFGRGASESTQIPATAACYSCHGQKGAVDNTFVQFYPTLIAVAKQKGTLRAGALETPPPSPTVRDVVCGMDIAQGDAVGKADYKGKTYYFCSQDCKNNFDHTPEKYVK